MAHANNPADPRDPNMPLRQRDDPRLTGFIGAIGVAGERATNIYFAPADLLVKAVDKIAPRLNAGRRWSDFRHEDLESHKEFISDLKGQVHGSEAFREELFRRPPAGSVFSEAKPDANDPLFVADSISGQAKAGCSKWTLLQGMEVKVAGMPQRISACDFLGKAFDTASTDLRYHASIEDVEAGINLVNMISGVRNPSEILQTAVMDQIRQTAKDQNMLSVLIAPALVDFLSRIPDNTAREAYLAALIPAASSPSGGKGYDFSTVIRLAVEERRAQQTPQAPPAAPQTRPPRAPGLHHGSPQAQTPTPTAGQSLFTPPRPTGPAVPHYRSPHHGAHRRNQAQTQDTDPARQQADREQKRRAQMTMAWENWGMARINQARQDHNPDADPADLAISEAQRTAIVHLNAGRAASHFNLPPISIFTPRDEILRELAVYDYFTEHATGPTDVATFYDNYLAAVRAWERAQQEVATQHAVHGGHQEFDATSTTQTPGASGSAPAHEAANAIDQSSVVEGGLGHPPEPPTHDRQTPPLDDLNLSRRGRGLQPLPEDTYRDLLAVNQKLHAPEVDPDSAIGYIVNSDLTPQETELAIIRADIFLEKQRERRTAGTQSGPLLIEGPQSSNAPEGPSSEPSPTEVLDVPMPTDAEKQTIPDPVVAWNMDMMAEPLNDLLLGESWGGNAGSTLIDTQRVLAAGANGYVDPNSGNILAFGNIQDIDPSIRLRGRPFIMRVATLPKNGEFVIRQCHFQSEDITPQARARVEEAIRRYNQRAQGSIRPGSPYRFRNTK